MTVDMANKTDIVVIGGYGSVGRTISQRLAKSFPGRVYAAGRSAESARRFSEETQGAVKPLVWTIESGTPRKDLSTIALIIMCLDQTEPHFIAQCLEEDTHYIDITANVDFLLRAESLQVSNPQAAAILSVGLAPGLTNLLAAKAAAALDTAEKIEISLMLGLGEQHGQAAIEWTIDSMGANFEVQAGGQLRQVLAMTEGLTADFGGKIGNRRVYRFPFSDQRTLPSTLGVPEVSTRLGFDVKGIARSAAALRKLGTFRLLRWSPLRRLSIKLAGAIHAGSEDFAVQVIAYGTDRGKSAKVSCVLRGSRQSDITAHVAAYTAERLLATPDLRGILHMEQWLDADSVWAGARQPSSSDLEVTRYD